MIFCDWLDVTFGPSDAPYPELNRLLLHLGFEVLDTGDRSKMVYLPGENRGGRLELRQTARFDRVSISGAVCARLRELDAWAEVLSILSDQPHKVTRLDAAMDLAMDGADLVARMRERYPETVNLGRKALRTTVMLKARLSDGRQTGTWYAGHRSAARLTARVYDKAFEVLERTGEEIPPRARIEVTARKDYGATLRDALEPAAIFWEAAAPAILPVPEVVPMRGDPVDTSWRVPPKAVEPAQLLARRVENLAELDRLLTVADEMGPGGRAYLLQLLRKRLGVERACEGFRAVV